MTSCARICGLTFFSKALDPCRQNFENVTVVGNDFDATKQNERVINLNNSDYAAKLGVVC